MVGRPIPQLEALVDFLEQNPGIVKGQLRTAQAKQETKRRWASLATTLNALGGANKDGAGWAKISQMGTPAPSGNTEELHSDPPFLIETIAARSTTAQPQPTPMIPTPTQPEPLQSLRRSLLRSPRRPCRVRPSSISSGMERMARLEERRVTAETVTAQAFADATVKLDGSVCCALEQLSKAMREGTATIANALSEIAVWRN